MSKKKVGIILDDGKQFHSMAEQLVKQIKIRDKKIKESENEQDR